MENLQKLMDTASSNVGFLLISVTIIAVLILSAYGAEVIIAKKHGIQRKQENLKVKRMAIIAMLAGIAAVLTLFEFPLGFVPGFYKLDFSEIPIIIGAFTLGPVAGLTIELIKIFLNLLLDGTSSAFVGEFANFLIGSAFVIPASFLYFLKKSRKSAVIGLSCSTVLAAILGGCLNAFLLLPKYAQLMGPKYGLSYDGMMASLIGMGTDVNSAIQGMSSFILYAVVPFNLLKYGGCAIVTILIYKKISHILKGNL